MFYQIKKAIFFLFAILSFPVLLMWLIFYFYSALGVGIDLFYQEAIMFPVFLSLPLLDAGSIIYLIFYRKECCVWPKLLMLFTGTVSTYTSMLVHNESPIYTIGDPFITNRLDKSGPDPHPAPFRRNRTRHSRLAYHRHGQIPEAGVKAGLSQFEESLL